MRKRRGIALPLTLLAGALLLVLAAWMITLGTSSLDRVKSDTQGAVALYAAEAGLASAEDALHQDSAWGAPGISVTPSDGNNVPYNSTTSEARYSLEVTNNSAGQTDLGNETPGVHLPPGVSVPAGDVYVVSSGRAGRASRSVAAMLAVTAGVPVFQFAALGVDAVTLTDETRTSNINSNGIATAEFGRVAASTVTVGPRARVAGDIAVPNASQSAVDADAATYEALVAVRPWPMAGMTPVSAAQHPGLVPVELARGAATLPPGSYEDIDVGGGTLTLQSGEYDIRSLNVEGGQIVTTGTPSAPTRLFFWGSFSVQGSGDINAGGSAPSLLVFGTAANASERSVSFGGATSCTVALFAPSLAVQVQDDARITGSVVAHSVTVAGKAELLYDEALKTVVAGGGDIRVVSYVRF